MVGVDAGGLRKHHWIIAVTGANNTRTEPLRYHGKQNPVSTYKILLHFPKLLTTIGEYYFAVFLRIILYLLEYRILIGCLLLLLLAIMSICVLFWKSLYCYIVARLLVWLFPEIWINTIRKWRGGSVTLSLGQQAAADQRNKTCELQYIPRNMHTVLLCFACCGYAIVHNEFTWSIYPYSSGLLCWHWGNR